MREIVLDTETTGFDPEAGDRIVEIGAVELNNHLPTGKTFHKYINPQRDMPESAFQVHGLSTDFLADKPVFAAIAQEFVDFIGDSPLVIHNASFDMKFLNFELKTAAYPQIPYARAIDTLLIARNKFPGAGNSLDALCRRFGVDNSAREKHGALLDSEILAEVYLELVGGRQPDLTLATASGAGQSAALVRKVGQRPSPLPPRITVEETAAHTEFTAKLGENSIWSQRLKP
ncbi:MAG: DNA polymerase III subunit epsilon [Cypionkella sp.]|nr:DNA polymerase III subunit epsilon [Cypionkella sp.]